MAEEPKPTNPDDPKPVFPWWIFTVIALILTMISIIGSQYAMRMSFEASRRATQIQIQR